jgi:acyl carrier protein
MMASDERGAPQADVIASQVLDFLQRELLSPGTTVGRNDDLLAGEVLDSIDVLRLAAFVAEAFRIEIRPADFVIENFRTVATIAAYVERTRASQAPDGSSQ